MAAEGNSQFELKAHAKTYDGFVGLLKVGTIVTAIIALIVVLLIAN